MIYGYIRVSTDRQDTENQKLGINDKARMLGIEVESWIADDGVSGAKEPDERLLGKLLKKIKKDDVIIASELSRLGRKLFMIMRILEHCMKVEAKVYTVKDGYELGDNIQSKVLAFAFGLAAEIERDMISKRTIEGLARRRMDGQVLGRPVGSKSGKRKLDEKETKIKTYLNAGLSFSAIGRLLKCHRLTVSSIAKERGWVSAEKLSKCQSRKAIKKTSIFYCPVDNIELIEMYKASYSLAKIAQNLDVNYGGLVNYCKKNGLMPLMQELNEVQRKKVPSRRKLEAVQTRADTILNLQ